MAPDALAQVLRPLEAVFSAMQSPRLLVGLGPLSDDAAVYKINDESALIATLDFITPIVDDPYLYGAIAAANAMSDVYAMGGQMALALNIACLPESLPREVSGEILRGGAEKVREAGAILVGGHSVDDREPKYGLVAIGFVHPDQVLTKAGACPGDVLVLTKPLGVGIITTVLKAAEAAPAHVAAALTSMLNLNKVSSELLRYGQVRAATDVTGFALIGHACEMAAKSGVRLRFDANRIPFLPGAHGYAEQWLFPAGTHRNAQYYGDRVCFDATIADELRHLLYTPETSGGLLAAVPPRGHATLAAAFQAAGQPLWTVGEVLAGTGPLVEFGP